jgi:hypothetical protein
VIAFSFDRARLAAALACVLGGLLGGCVPAALERDDDLDENENTTGHEPDPLAEVPGRRPTEPEARAIAQLLRVAEETRSLRFARPVPFRIQDRDVITQFVRDQIEEDELERARVFYVALGLLDAGLDIHDLLVRVLGEQIVGYYDPERGLMVIREDVATQLAETSLSSGLGEAEMVIVHELVHALQDQRLELGAHYREERTIDAENAFAALVEGDATLAMIGHLASRNGQPLSALTRNAAMLRMLVNANPQAMQGQEIDRAPPIVRIPLVSRYLDGMVFCATLHGGAGWRGVDSAHAVPPASTEQVMHADRYIRGEQPDAIDLPDLPALTAAGLVPHEEDTLGELEMGIWFGLGRSGVERDESAAEGWGGDRLRVYRGAGGDTAGVWFTSWDDEGEAREAEAAAIAVLEALPAARSPHQRVLRRGRAVLVLLDLPAPLQAAAVAAFETFAAGLPAAPPSSTGPSLDASGRQG